jgi:hypothetical protein
MTSWCFPRCWPRVDLPLAVTTLIIAVVGLVLASLSFVWQTYSFILEGPRVRVEFQQGIRGVGGVMVAPPSAYTDDGLRALAAQGYTESVLVIEAINTGRFPATVRDWSIVFGNRAIWSNPIDGSNPSLPRRLEPGSSETWLANAAQVIAVANAFSDGTDAAATARGVVRLGTNERIVTQRALIIRAGGIVEAPAGRVRTILERLSPKGSR